ncbi:Gfo/Idh/MocA family oxidoreductase [uncultured Erythrobacter sp.]|uniref:Gfo/Idh/MocA family protein n=1 Tax=uncultured Erythrobacter sp. TaxID=263913 RepID=UPI00262B74CC|nr:Gfo/Idh/MocA family oxidoreductase [uncultured Erythrobacter sp.]
MAYKVLIIGCGAIAGGYDAERSPDDWPLSHAGAIARDDRFDIWACFDTDDDARYDFMDRWDVPICLGELEPPFAKPGDFDVVVIASPTQFHAEHLEYALTLRPKLVFCEKPLAADLEGARNLAAQFDTARIPLAVNYTRRWAPDLVELAQEVRAGDWGTLISAIGTYTKGIVHNGSHMVDLLGMFVGEMRVHSVGPGWCDFWDDDPTVSTMLTTGDLGLPIHLIAGDAEHVTHFELVLNYERGEIAMRDGGMRIETRRVQDSETFAGYRQLGLPERMPGRYPEAMTQAYANIAEALDTGARLASTAQNAIEAHKFCEEIRLKALETIKKDPE